MSEKLIQYQPGPDKPLWKCERFAELSEDFGVGKDQIVQFHAIAELQLSSWNILRRLYGINPIIVPVDTDAKYLRVWTIEDIAQDLEINTAEAEAELSIIVANWRKWKNQHPVEKALPTKEKAKPKPPTPRPPEPPIEKIEIPDAQAKPEKKPEIKLPPLTDELKRNLMAQYGFPDQLFSGSDTIESAMAERNFFAQRVEHLQKILDEPMVASLGRQALVNELMLLRIESKMFRYDVLSIEFSELQETKKTIEKNYGEQWTQINKLCPWADQIDKKMTFTNALSDIIDAIREYYSNQSTARIDGLHTAYQLQILMREAEQHPIRYRLGQTMAIVEALRPEALWDRDWKRSFTDEHCKIIDAGFQGAASKMRESLGIGLTDLESDHPVSGEYPPLFIPLELDEPAKNIPIDPT